MSKDKAKISIIVGSDSDLSIVKEATDILKKFEIEYDIKILSAHRTPKALQEYLQKAEKDGIQIFIAAAGAAAHLAGAIAGHTILPVIGIPIPSSTLQGLDALLSTVQMPKGIPVLTTAIGKAGAGNAAISAIQILSLSDNSLKTKMKQYRKKMADDIEKKNKLLDEKGIDDYVK